MESKNNSGFINKNKFKTKETHPDYKGTVNVNGKDMEISLWIKESKKDGSKFFSVSFQEPYKKDTESKTYSNETKYIPKIEDDGLPF